MGFAKDIPNYKTYENSKDFLYSRIPHVFWTKLFRFIENAGLKSSELRLLLNRFSRILHIEASSGWEHEELSDDVLRAIKAMESYVSDGRMDILMDCLACFPDMHIITESDLNEFLQTNQIGYALQEGKWSVVDMELETNTKQAKIFISHAYNDQEYIERFVRLLEFIGLGTEQIFCSSVPGYGVPEGKDIYQHLQEQFEQYDLHVFYMLSDNYYQSAAALNEMGAAWILQMRYTTILLPGFEYKKIKGAVNPYIISAKLDSDRYQVRDMLRQIKEKLEKEFNLRPKAVARWDKEVDIFIEDIMNMKQKRVLA